MPDLLSTQSAPGEHGSFYVGYVPRIAAGHVVWTLETQIADTLALVHTFGDARAEHRYAPGKWSVKEVVGHLADTERIFTYRALRVARGDTTPLPGFDENAFVAHGGFARRTLGDVAAELEIVRRATIAFFAGLGDDALLRQGTANGAPVTPRAVAYVIAGHERHHAAILRERYG